MADNSATEAAERRKTQRFIATRRGEQCFWVIIDGQRHPLSDLSLSGFAMPASSPLPAGKAFEFVLQRANVPDEIRGFAKVVNHIQGAGSGQAGCLFEPLEPAAIERLEDWLAAHVLMNASVPINERDAARIVTGPSLI
ncbi:MAG TPA: PilZ domain-containing protein [Azoarcus taiwanensis]|nr:PilZ domain-containing protein [Azoarcus taiwanensis]